jgi:hypothetical protein
VQEADRFNVITAANIDYKNLGLLPANLKIKLLGGPIMVSLRDIELNSQETTNDSIEFESKYRSGRPNLYVKYNGTRAYKNAYPIRNLIITQPDKKELVENLAFASDEINTNQLRYMYILGHHTWIVILKTTGEPIGYMNSK